jgi:outer membrane lipoprotein carrier protein
LRFRALLFCLTFFYYVFNVHSFAITPEELVRQTEKEALGAATLIVDFKLSIHWQLRDTLEEKSGKIYLKKPEKYRIELGDNLIVSDGETFWRYSKKNRQLVINRIRDIESDFQPGQWLFKYSDQYKPAGLDSAVQAGEKCYGVRLVPKEEGARFDSLQVWISGKNSLPIKIETKDKNDNSATYTIDKIVRNTELADKLFRFSPPKGTEVIDMRQ